MTEHDALDPLWDDDGHATVEVLLARLDGATVPPEVIGHLDTCKRCDLTMKELSAVAELVRDVPPAPDGLLEDATARALAQFGRPALMAVPVSLDQRRRRMTQISRFVAAAAAVVVVGIGVSAITSRSRGRVGDSPAELEAARNVPTSTVTFQADAVVVPPPPEAAPVTEPTSPDTTPPPEGMIAGAVPAPVPPTAPVGAPAPTAVAAASGTPAAAESAGAASSGTATTRKVPTAAKSAAPPAGDAVAPAQSASASVPAPAAKAAAPQAARAAPVPEQTLANAAPASTALAAAPQPAAATASPTSVASVASPPTPAMPAVAEPTTTLDQGRFADLAAVLTSPLVTGSTYDALPMQSACADSLRQALGVVELRFAAVRIGERSVIIGIDRRPNQPPRVAAADPVTCVVSPQDITPTPGTSLPTPR